MKTTLLVRLALALLSAATVATAADCVNPGKGCDPASSPDMCHCDTGAVMKCLEVSPGPGYEPEPLYEKYKACYKGPPGKPQCVDGKCPYGGKLFKQP